MQVRHFMGLILAAAILSPTWISTAFGIEVIAHRGANRLAPENTLASAQKCIELGVDYIEVDVMLSKDGVMYNIHDPAVNRTTDGKGLIAALTSQQIDALDAGSWFDPKFAGERIPRHDTFLPQIKGKIKINFDIKFANLKELIRLIRENGMQDECFLHPSNLTMALKLRELAPDLIVKIDVSTPEEAERAATMYGARIVETNMAALTPTFWEVCHKHNLKVICCAQEDSRDEYKRIIASGADMAMVNAPDLFLEVLREKGMR